MGAFPTGRGSFTFGGSLGTGGASDTGISPILHVAVDGSDNKNGRTWGTALKTVSKALSILNDTEGGTIQIESGSWASDEDGVGIWISGANDVGTAPTGWVKVNFAPNLIWVPQVNGVFGFGQGLISPGNGAPNFADSVIQIAGTLGSVNVQNFNCVQSNTTTAPASRAGLSSPLVVWNSGTTYPSGASVVFGSKAYISLNAGNVGNQPDISPLDWLDTRPDIADGLSTSLTAFLNYTNCTFSKAGTTGPSHDIGRTFWAWYNQVAFIRTGITGTNEIDECGARFYACVGPGNVTFGSYLQYFDNCRTQGGSIYSNGANTFTDVRRILGEDQLYPVFHAVRNVTGDVAGNFFDVQSADSINVFGIVNDTNGLIRATNCLNVKGLAEIDNTDFATNLHTLSGGQFGDVGAISLRQQDSARRLFAPNTARYPNVSLQPTNWIGSTIVGPDGGATSGLVINSLMTFYNQNAIPCPPIHVGDRMAWGVNVNFVSVDPSGSGWVLENIGTGPITLEVGGSGASAGKTITLAGGQSVGWIPAIPMVRNTWYWVGGYLKVTALDPAAALVIQGGPQTANTVAYNEAWLIIAPATDTDVSDNEVALMALHAGPTPGVQIGAAPAVTPTPGMPALWPGQKIAFLDANDGTWKYLDIFAGVPRVTT